MISVRGVARAAAVMLFVGAGVALGAPIIHENGKSAQVVATGASLQDVSGLALRPDGGLYASTESGKIVSISWSGNVQQIADLSAVAVILSNIAVDSNGLILVGDASAVSPSNNIYEVSPTTGQATLVYGDAYSPTDIHLDAQGNLLVAERLGIEGVSRIARDGSWHEVVFRASDYGWTGVPTGIDIDAQGNLLVGYRDDGAIYRVPPVGEPELFADVPNGNSVLALCFSPNGDLFAANDLTGEIYKIDSNGTANLFASGIDRPRYMTFDAAGHMYFAACNEATVYEVVPEPATLALLALGGLGMLARRRSVRG